MNEGHASFLTLELLLRYKRPIEDVWDERLVWDVDRVKISACSQPTLLLKPAMTNSRMI